MELQNIGLWWLCLLFYSPAPQLRWHLITGCVNALTPSWTQLRAAVLLFVLVWKHVWRRLAGGPWGLDKDVWWFSAAWSIWCRFHISRLPWFFIIGVLLGFLRVRDSSARHWAFCSVNAGSGHFTNSQAVGASLYTYLQSPVVSQWIISARLVALTLFSPVLDADPLCYAATPKSFLITGG